MWYRDLKEFFRDRYNQKMAAVFVVVAIVAVLLAVISDTIWPAQPP
jgi:Na+/proline symporter